jgi:hypothetical protein
MNPDPQNSRRQNRFDADLASMITYIFGSFLMTFTQKVPVMVGRARKYEQTKYIRDIAPRYGTVA